MDFWQVINQRKSVRGFNPQKRVPKELIEKIIKAAHQAPSAGDVHPESFVIVYEEEAKKKLAQVALNQDFISQAPVVIVVLADLDKSAFCYGDRGRELYAICDTSAAIENLLLAATALGLSTCWIGAFDEEKIREALKIKKGVRPIAIIPLGYKKD